MKLFNKNQQGFGMVTILIITAAIIFDAIVFMQMGLKEMNLAKHMEMVGKFDRFKKVTRTFLRSEVACAMLLESLKIPGATVDADIADLISNPNSKKSTYKIDSLNFGDTKVPVTLPPQKPIPSVLTNGLVLAQVKVKNKVMSYSSDEHVFDATLEIRDRIQSATSSRNFEAALLKINFEMRVEFSGSPFTGKVVSCASDSSESGYGVAEKDCKTLVGTKTIQQYLTSIGPFSMECGAP